MKRLCQCDQVDQCRLCWLYAHDPAHHRHWGGPGLGPHRTPLPCVHLGEATGETAACGPCGDGVRLKLFRCAKHGACTAAKPVDGHACCTACPDAERDTFRLVAPLGTRDQAARWEGRPTKRPWHYAATCILPHLDTLEHLEACVDLLRLQTAPPYIVVVDTGSPPAVCAAVERMRSDDLEVHYVRGNGYTHSSEPVAVALDLGMARVNTERILLLHTDVFLRRRDAVAWLLAQCDADHPAVGWEMSSRSWITDKWRGMVSHTFTALHAPTMRRIGMTWHMQRGRDLLGMGLDYSANGWPDTETTFGMVLQAAGIRPVLLGDEPNFQRHVTEWFDHARSSAGLKAYSPGSAMHHRAETYAAAALAEARRRASEWQANWT